MTDKSELWCVMCGAGPGKPCTVISGEEGESPGDERRYFHSARGSREKPTTLIKDEPPYEWSATQKGVE